jgi:hypothetical protein
MDAVVLVIEAPSSDRRRRAFACAVAGDDRRLGEFVVTLPRRIGASA